MLQLPVMSLILFVSAIAGLKENAIRSTWQFPSPSPALADAASELSVPPSSPPQYKKRKEKKKKEQQATAAQHVQQQQAGGSSNWCGDNPRLGSAEQQYGHVNWSATLRSDVWGDQMTRYVGVNPQHKNGEDWRSPRLQAGNPKVQPPEGTPLGASSPAKPVGQGGSGGGQAAAAAAASGSGSGT